MIKLHTVSMSGLTFLEVLMKQETIIIQNLHKSYGKKKVTTAVDVCFYSGQIVALVGHNGAGKTTLLNQITGMVTSDKGAIWIQGINISKQPSKARELVSSMPQFQAPLKGVSVQEAIECIGALKGLKRKDTQKRANDLIAYLDIEKWRHTSGEKLSGGLQRLTSFAMSVVDTPSIIVLDEPTNDVDPYRRTLMWRYLRNLAHQGATVIIVSHNLFEVERYADRYLLMEKGQIKKDVQLSERPKKQQVQHQLAISGIEKEDIKSFTQAKKLLYDDMEKRLTITLDDSLVTEMLTHVLDLLQKKKSSPMS